ncbi:MAG: choice-of-anchor J domain-containing protein [Lentimicrobiaceae bacterium]|nr:choice-of-anchor J domain-containing protein [Lentimicrobiaceae bacterium]
MKLKNLLVIAALLVLPFGLYSQNAWINEIHYDNASTDADEIVEVVIENASSYDIADFSVILYNGNGGAMYSDTTLDVFTEGATVGNFTIYYFNYTLAGKSIQNGAPDGVALSYQGNLINGQFLSYEGTFDATDGPAAGVSSVDIGVEETGTTFAGLSLQLSGSGSQYAQFTWVDPATATAGQLNNNQTFGGYTPDPEPSNFPGSFAATVNGVTIKLTWADATGTQLPAGYLILASTNAAINAPVDGIPVADDLDMSDGLGAKNIEYGVQQFTFEGLASATIYHFVIYPYTNFGQYIDYKITGTVPAATATSATLVHFQDFENGLTPWTQYSVTGDQIWQLDSIHGINQTMCAKMSGYYDTVNYVNEDWLISPQINLGNYIHGLLGFYTAMKYGSGDNTLTPMYSINYSGTGNPNNAAWTPLTAILSEGNWAWTYSGNIDISVLNDQSFYIAFKYISETEARTWEVDNVVVTGIPEGIGISDPVVKETGASIYPNPSQGVFTINSPFDNVTVTVYSLVGANVYQTTSLQKSCKIDISQLPDGIYFVKVYNTLNGNSVTKKIQKR